MEIYRAYAKINWALAITGIKDGYHMLDSVMETIDLCDILTLSPAESFSVTAQDEQGKPFTDTLCHSAGKAFFACAGIPGDVHVHIHKGIPDKAGFGGGSSDCGNLLAILNNRYGCPLSESQLFALAEALGADVPFFLTGGCQRAKGKGERLTPVHHAQTYHLLVVKPKGGIDTREAFSRYDSQPKSSAFSMDGLVSALETGDLPGIGREMQNVLEPVSIQMLPEIGVIKHELLNTGAFGAVMTGSGAAVIGLFSRPPKDLSAFDGYWVRMCRTVSEPRKEGLAK